MKVLHSDADSITTINPTDDGPLVYGITGIASGPRLEVSARGPARIDAVLYSGTLNAARRVPSHHPHALVIKSFVSAYVDSGALDSYRANVGHGVPRLAL